MSSIKHNAHKVNSVEFMTDFINLYRSLPVLWKVKSADYSNKFKKEEAYKKMVELGKTVYEDSNLDFVKSKINTIRGCFRKELKKVVASQRSGASSDDIYVPKLWYYDLLGFTVDQEIPRHSASSIPDEDCEGIESGQGENDNSNAELPDKDEPLNTQDLPNLTPSNKTALGRKRIAKRSGVSKEAAKELLLAKAEKALDRDEFDSYFESVAAKMRRMNEEQQLFAEKIINESVFLGMFNRLTEFSHVNTPTMTFPQYNQVLYSTQGNFRQVVQNYPSTSECEPSPPNSSESTSMYSGQ